MMNRREAIQKSTLAAGALAVSAALPSAFAQTTTPAPTTAAPAAFSLPALPYAYDALEPHIDAQTMQIHHDKHHAAYVTNLNKAVASINFPTKGIAIESLIQTLEAVPEPIRKAVQNQGGGHYNHSLFWQMMKKNGGGQPTAELAAAMDKTFGSFDGFKEKFSAAALKQFGSGWAWLTIDTGKKLAIESTANQDSPLSAGRLPLLGIDVWEHAYYLKYHNVRADYIAAFYNVINWEFVLQRYIKGV